MDEDIISTTIDAGCSSSSSTLNAFQHWSGMLDVHGNAIVDEAGKPIPGGRNMYLIWDGILTRNIGVEESEGLQKGDPARLVMMPAIGLLMVQSRKKGASGFIECKVGISIADEAAAADKPGQEDDADKKASKGDNIEETGKEAGNKVDKKAGNASVLDSRKKGREDKSGRDTSTRVRGGTEAGSKPRGQGRSRDRSTQDDAPHQCQEVDGEEKTRAKRTNLKIKLPCPKVQVRTMPLFLRCVLTVLTRCIDFVI